MADRSYTERQAARGLRPHWKVRVILRGAWILLASLEEPEAVVIAGELAGVEAEWITDPDYGDTLGFIQWPEVVAVSWRYAAGALEDGAAPR